MFHPQAYHQDIPYVLVGSVTQWLEHQSLVRGLSVTNAQSTVDR